VRRINLFLNCRFGELNLMLYCSNILAQPDYDLLNIGALLFDLEQ